MRWLTIDLDGPVVYTGLQAQWALRGFNPHHRKVPSCYPVMAYETHTGQFLQVKNHPGSTQDGKASVSLLRELFTQVRSTLGRQYPLEFPTDEAFFRQDVLQLLESRGSTCTIKVPFYIWVDFKAFIQQRRQFQRVDRSISYFS